MKIGDYSIQTTGAHKLEQHWESTGEIKVWTRPQNKETDSDVLSYSIDIGHQDAEMLKAKEAYTQNTMDTDSYLDQEAKIKLKLIESFIYHTTGKMVRLLPAAVKIEREEVVRRLPGDVLDDPNQIPPPPEEGWGLTYDYREVFEEVESVRFRSNGTVTTRDGKAYAFELQFTMDRSFYQENAVNIRMGDAVKVDPLVVVYGGGTPGLGQRQAFDLDADGKDDQIAMPTDGSGFLALDKNGNGVIDDGSELFGPENGDGFEALRLYDEDNNHWIDEADDVFDRLSIMAVNELGQQTLFKLGEMGIGAIFLDEVKTQFGFRDAVSDKGALRSSSVFLREDGTAGTIHHIDLSL